MGAALDGQRWNEKSVRAAYASATLSLAALEYLVRIATTRNVPADLVSVFADVDDRQVESFDAGVVPGWDAAEPGASVVFGTGWIRERRSVALRVPSVIIPREANYVLNPLHPAFAGAVRPGMIEPFRYDGRLVRGVAGA